MARPTNSPNPTLSRVTLLPIARRGQRAAVGRVSLVNEGTARAGFPFAGAAGIALPFAVVDREAAHLPSRLVDVSIKLAAREDREISAAAAFSETAHA